MEVDYLQLEKNLKDLERKYLRAKSISSKKNIAIDLLVFEEIYSSLSTTGTPPIWLGDKQMDKAIESMCGQLINDFLNYYNENYQFFTSSSKNVLDIYKEVGFNSYLKKNSFYKKINKNEALEILYSFLNSVDPKYYKIFKQLIDDKYLLMPYIFEQELSGSTHPLFSINKSYVTCASKDYDASSLSTLIHEAGHLFELNILYGKSHNHNIFYSEVTSLFFGYLFLNYLLDNRILFRDAKTELYYLYRELQYNMFDNFFTSFVAMNIDCNCMIDINNDYCVNVIKFLNNLYDIRYDIDFKEPYDAKTGLVYGYGGLIAISLYEKYMEDKKNFVKNFDASICRCGIVKDISFLNNVGIKKEDFYQNKSLKRALTNYLRNYS